MTFRATVRRIDLDAAGFRSIELYAPDYRFRSGQYLSIACDGVTVPLSIASSAHRLPSLHLIYRSDAQSDEALALDSLLRTCTTLQLNPSGGDVALPDDWRQRHLHLIAAGSGLAGALGLADAALSEQVDAKLTLHTTSRHTPTWLVRMQQHYPGFACHTLDRKTLRSHPWSPDDNAWYLLCGPPEFVYEQFDQLKACGVADTAMASDVFAYAPRS